MAKVQAFKKDGTASAEVELNDAIFNARINKRLLDDVIRAYGNNKRTGTAHTKERSDVRGGGKKPWRQKGTGRARTSTIRNPIWRGGGTIFGPRKRDIYTDIPRKLRQKALISALSSKVQSGDVIIVDDLALAEAKTKEFYNIVKALSLTSPTVLCLVTDKSDAIVRASNNVFNVTLKSAGEFNAYHVMRKKKILLEKSAIDQIVERVKDVV